MPKRQPTIRRSHSELETNRPSPQAIQELLSEITETATLAAATLDRMVEAIIEAHDSYANERIWELHRRPLKWTTVIKLLKDFERLLGDTDEADEARRRLFHRGIDLLDADLEVATRVRLNAESDRQRVATESSPGGPRRNQAAKQMVDRLATAWRREISDSLGNGFRLLVEAVFRLVDVRTTSGEPMTGSDLAKRASREVGC